MKKYILTLAFATALLTGCTTNKVAIDNLRAETATTATITPIKRPMNTSILGAAPWTRKPPLSKQELNPIKSHSHE